MQIGNAITEKMLIDVILAARDRGLVHGDHRLRRRRVFERRGRNGEQIGAEVWLDRRPAQIRGLSYTEIWISEAQERMVLAVPPAQLGRLSSSCARPKGSKRRSSAGSCRPGDCVLKYHEHRSADLAMDFLHDGRPPVVRDAVYTPPRPLPLAARARPQRLHRTILLHDPRLAQRGSKEWVIRQYDHEVQGGSVVKPLVGVANDGPCDAAVVRPVLRLAPRPGASPAA